MDEVTLVIEGQTFKARKDVLCEHSDYFRAMFSGCYVENEQTEINIDIVDAISMQAILQYMENSLNLDELSISELSQLAVNANFLQITELLTRIEDALYDQLTASNWIEILATAELLSFTNLKHLSAAFGLLSFNSMRPEYIKSIDKLCWYLSHPYLKTDSELDVFKFGLEWMKQNATQRSDDSLQAINGTETESLQAILCCIDISRLITNDLSEIKTLIKEYVDALAARSVVDSIHNHYSVGYGDQLSGSATENQRVLVSNMFTEKLRIVDCLYKLRSASYELSASVISDEKVLMCYMFTESVFNEVVNLVTHSKIRRLTIVPTIPAYSCLSNENQPIDNPESVSHFMYAYTEFGFYKWLEIPVNSIQGWKVVAWGLTKLVLVCGKYYGKSEHNDNEIFMKDVMVYDTLTKKWKSHGVELPPRENGAVAVLGDSLYIIGGKGVNRKPLHSAVIYDLKLKTFREIANFPMTKKFEEPPVLCVHDNMVYGAALKDVYRFEDRGGSGRWVNVFKSIVTSNIRISSMVSYEGYIYCTLRYFHMLFRFKPHLHKNLQEFTDLNNSAVAMCNLGNRVLAFTMTKDESEMLTVEGYVKKDNNVTAEVLSSQTDPSVKVHKYAGCCVLVTNLPPVDHEVSDYHKQYIVT